MRIVSSFTALAILLAGTVSAFAVTIQNADPEARTVTITEKGVRSELKVDANATASACADGCFISFPSGDMIAVKGSEEIVIENGKGRVLNN